MSWPSCIADASPSCSKWSWEKWEKRLELGEHSHLWVRRRQKCDGNLHGHEAHGRGSKRMGTGAWFHHMLPGCETSVWQCFTVKSELGDEGDERSSGLGWCNLEGADRWQVRHMLPRDEDL